MQLNTLSLGLIGFGEVGRILAQDIGARGPGRLSAYDLRFDVEGDPLAGEAAAMGVERAADIASLCRSADVVISAVTAGAAVAVAKSAAAHLDGALFVDVNSISPGAKQDSAACIDAAGGRYVEAAVMAPYPPKRLGTPILLGGPHAADFALLAQEMGMNAQAFSDAVGRASAVKMCRSVFVKGLESIVSESLISARRYGVEQEVIASLSNTIPHANWPELAKYLISRTLIHGRRRSEEMVEVVRTLEDKSLPAWMSEGSVRRQQWAADLHLAYDEAQTLEQVLDAILEQAAKGEKTGPATS